MLQDMLSFLCQTLLGRTQCKPAETQLPGEKDTEATVNCRELQAGLQEKTASDSKEINRSNVTPKKTTVLIKAEPRMDFEQVG